MLIPLLRAAVLSLTLVTPALAIDAEEMFTDPEKEARARDIGRQLRCLVCNNQSIFDSNAELARDLRIVVRERMTIGESDGQVLEYIRERYGDYVLLKPPVDAQTYALWLAPVGFLLLGAFGLGTYLRGRRRETPLEELTDDDRAEAARLLGREGR